MHDLDPKPPHSLIWMDTPAERWDCAISIGNGVIAGMVHGGVTRERIALNHGRLIRSQLQNENHCERVGDNRAGTP